jgi:ectoine hydroxylase-related dioxygenase (phytanoyl-CoA dioxygenase family)
MAEPVQRQRVGVTVDQYRSFRRDGFVVVPGVVSPAEVDELRQHTEDLMAGRLPEQQGAATARQNGDGVDVTHFGKPPEDLSPQERANFFLRIHMLHRKLELHERYLMHPGVLDVLEVLIGPDVLALQTMLFLKPPGSAGQGWHQDSFYIPSHPDTLCGAWIAIDPCDEYNGAMWFAKGSGTEPVYPPCPEAGYGFGDKMIDDIRYVKGISNTDDRLNALSRVADRYDQVLVCAKPGDVVFFNGHVLHRSKQNVTSDRYRRSFVSHYCNARSFTQWGADDPNDPANKGQTFDDVHRSPVVDPVTGMTNGSHILARGDTHLPFAQPKFGTPCAATQSREERQRHMQYVSRVIAEHNNGLMGCGIADPTVVDDDD